MKVRILLDDGIEGKTLMRFTPSNPEDRAFLEGMWVSAGTSPFMVKMRIVEEPEKEKYPWAERHYIEILRY